MDKQKLEQIIQDPMGSDDIIHYFPHAKITTYADLHKYKSIKDLLPAQEDFVSYPAVRGESQGRSLGVPNKGHT